MTHGRGVCLPHRNVVALESYYESGAIRLRPTRFSPDARAAVSEPIGDLTEAWEEIPESTAIIIFRGEVEKHAFQPRFPNGIQFFAHYSRGPLLSAQGGLSS